jgi:hypothetical protein
MATFMKRLAENNVVDAATLDGLEPDEIVFAYGDSGPFGSTQLLSGVGKIEEISATVPRDGYLQILGSASTLNGTGATTLVWIQVDDTTCDNSNANLASVGFGYANTSGATSNLGTAYAEGFVAVSAGTHTVSLCGNQFLGTSVNVYGPSISAVFLDNVSVVAGLFSGSEGSIPGSK